MLGLTLGRHRRGRKSNRRSDPSRVTHAGSATPPAAHVVLSGSPTAHAQARRLPRRPGGPPVGASSSPRPAHRRLGAPASHARPGGPLVGAFPLPSARPVGASSSCRASPARRAPLSTRHHEALTRLKPVSLKVVEPPDVLDRPG